MTFDPFRYQEYFSLAISVIVANTVYRQVFRNPSRSPPGAFLESLVYLFFVLSGELLNIAFCQGFLRLQLPRGIGAILTIPYLLHMIGLWPLILQSYQGACILTFFFPLVCPLSSCFYVLQGATMLPSLVPFGFTAMEVLHVLQRLAPVGGLYALFFYLLNSLEAFLLEPVPNRLKIRVLFTRICYVAILLFSRRWETYWPF